MCNRPFCSLQDLQQFFYHPRIIFLQVLVIYIVRTLLCNITSINAAIDTTIYE